MPPLNIFSFSLRAIDDYDLNLQHRKPVQLSGHRKYFACLACIHAKSGRYLRYISAIFFGFSAKFQAENAKSILHPSHRLRQHHLRWRQHHLRWKQHHLRWRQHHFRWKQHHFVSNFTIYALLSRFTFCRDLHTFSAFFFLAKIAFSATSHVFCMYGSNLP